MKTLVDRCRGVENTPASVATRSTPRANVAKFITFRSVADGDRQSDDAVVVSDEIGEPIGRFRTACVTAVLRAHGVKPEWKPYNWTALTPACQQAFKAINLHWHDLRHECASRLVERGVSLAQVRDLLGHASITTTERYDTRNWRTCRPRWSRSRAARRSTRRTQIA
jgi:hypothetical protein